MAKVVQQTRKIVILDPDTGAEVVTRERIWNYTLVDISLLAFGTSFPQISLAIIDAFQNLGQLYAGGLGPATLVVQVWTPNVVTIWEAGLTVLQFGLLLLHAYAQDKGWHYFSLSLPREDRPEDWVPAETRYSSSQGGSHEDSSTALSEFAPQNRTVDIFSINSNEQADNFSEHIPRRENVETFSLDGDLNVPAGTKGVKISLVFLQQLKDALTMEDYGTKKNSGVALRSLKILWRFINLPWRILFAFVPPCDIAHGWLAFTVSLCCITGISYTLTKLTNLISCVTGINPYVIAFTALASGTSWPDMVASKIAAERQMTADSAIANITCSNSANLFIGIGDQGYGLG
ncbi:hypothetical protein SUGI_0685240 [Cryptomeria japonica]|nr:hypothetical protein SUGI_0685240 [Cryptomeria japonica]